MYREYCVKIISYFLGILAFSKAVLDWKFRISPFHLFRAFSFCMFDANDKTSERKGKALIFKKNNGEMHFDTIHVDKYS